MEKKKTKTPASIYQLKITLAGVHPVIWRRLQVPSDITLSELHNCIQRVMGWEDYHMHQFTVRDVRYGPFTESVDDFGMEYEDEAQYKLDEVVQEGEGLIYEYDFGDGWEHEIKVEKILGAEPDVLYPRCLAGERSCPPEDCGGPWGYEELLRILKNSRHKEYRERREWAGKDFDPEKFDLG